MKIYFVEVESSERQFFESELSDHELHFVSGLEEVEADAEIVSTFIYSRIDGPFLDRHRRCEIDCHALYDPRPPRAGELC